jgi:MFS-type transporter involved in bile tolerance (Atg22 family)
MFTLHFKNIADVYQLNLKNAAIQSLFQFADFPLHISILQYWLLMAGISTFVYIILAIIFACIATNKNNRIIIAFDFILMIPFCLYLFKLKQAEYLSLPVILDTNRMLNSNQAIYAVNIILITISAIICLVRTSNKWKEQS